MMKDPYDSYTIHKERAFDMPFRVINAGLSGSAGKTTNIGNLFLRPHSKDDAEGQSFYLGDFKPENIFLISPSASMDSKLKNIMELLEVPPENIIGEYREEYLEAVHDHLAKRFHEAHEKYMSGESTDKPEHSIIILDDCSFGGGLKSKLHGCLAKIFCNSRKLLISCYMTTQKYCDILPVCRTNATGLILHELGESEFEQIYHDVGFVDKKTLRKIYSDSTKSPHEALIVRKYKNRSERFLNSKWQPIILEEESHTKPARKIHSSA